MYQAIPPDHAFISLNGGGIIQPSTYLLHLPDRDPIPFPLTTEHPLQWAEEWLKAHAPTIPLHPEFVLSS